MVDKYHVSIDMFSKELEEKIFKIEVIDKINEVAEIDCLIGECQGVFGNNNRYLYHFNFHTKREVKEIAKKYYHLLKENDIEIPKEYISILNTTRGKMVK